MRITFLILITLYGLIELVFGLFMMTDIEAVAAMFNAEYSTDSGVFSVPLTVAVFAFTSFSALAFLWVYKRKPEGALIGMVIGGWLICSAILSYVKLGMLDSLIVDGVRGVVILIIGYLLQKKYSYSS
jgi:hypothetical protein